MTTSQLTSNITAHQTTLGILGSGQLARMTSLAASHLGIKTFIYCPEDNISPAELISAKTYKGALSDLEKILTFVSHCGYVTLENEFIDQDILFAIESHFPGKLFPSAKTFKLIGDKISEKNHFSNAGIPVAPYQKVSTPEEVSQFAKNNGGFPVVLKSSKGGYDGYGNVTIKNEMELKEKFFLLKGELLVEAFIPYQKEVAIMIARNSSGEMVHYPIAHTIQENHICHLLSVPAKISTTTENKIISLAKKAMESIDAVGIFAFEFFLTQKEDIYLNESAPRPHNSGHYTIEGTITSQFENHVRSVLNLPLGATDLRAPFIGMLNLLGTQNGPAQFCPSDLFLNLKDGHLHLYGKEKSKIGRKMGHYTLLGTNEETVMNSLKNLKEKYTL